MDNKKLELNEMLQPQVSTENPASIVGLIAVKNLLDSKNKKANSRIKYIQVSELVRLFLYADVFKIPFVKKMADNILDLQISINGLGRKEIVELVNQSNNMESQTIRHKDIFR